VPDDEAGQHACDVAEDRACQCADDETGKGAAVPFWRGEIDRGWYWPQLRGRVVGGSHGVRVRGGCSICWGCCTSAPCFASRITPFTESPEKTSSSRGAVAKVKTRRGADLALRARSAWRCDRLYEPGDYLTGAGHYIYEEGMPRGVSNAPEKESRNYCPRDVPAGKSWAVLNHRTMAHVMADERAPRRGPAHAARVVRRMVGYADVVAAGEIRRAYPPPTHLERA
jgi:hypothetical protein